MVLPLASRGHGRLARSVARPSRASSGVEISKMPLLVRARIVAFGSTN
jgi:hypothetical protein